jgi:hypothetical protein
LRHTLFSIAAVLAMTATQSFAEPKDPFTQDDIVRASVLMEDIAIVSCWKEGSDKRFMPYIISKVDEETAELVNVDNWRGKRYDNTFIFNDGPETLRLSPNKMIYTYHDSIEEEDCLPMTEPFTEMVAVILNLSGDKTLGKLGNPVPDDLSLSEREELEILRKENENLKNLLHRHSEFLPD